MVKYVLTYFPIRGICEFIRQMFYLADVEYEDKRITKEEFFEVVQKNCPFAQVPILEVDGRIIPQSVSIARYLAKEFGMLYGKTNFEQALCDAIADQYRDFDQKTRPYLCRAYGFFITCSPEETARYRDELLLPNRDKYLAYLSDYLDKSRTGFLTGGEFTFVDLIVAEQTAALQTFVPEYAENFPKIKAHLEKVHAIPKLKRWLEIRPKTPY